MPAKCEREKFSLMIIYIKMLQQTLKCAHGIRHDLGAALSKCRKNFAKSSEMKWKILM